MAIDRATITRGPAIVIFDGVTYYTEDPIVCNMSLETLEIRSDANGKEDERILNIVPEITFKPVGKWAYAKALWNGFATPLVGTSLATANDKNLVIHAKNGRKLTFYGAFISSVPELHFSAGNTLLGSVTFMAVGKNNVESSNAEKLIKEEAAAFSDTSHNPDHEITQKYTLAWGTESPYNALKHEGGIKVSGTLSTKPETSDEEGIFDYTLQDFAAMPSFTPMNLTEAQLVTLRKLQGTGFVRGASLGALNSATLLITGTGVYAAFYGAAPKQGPMRFGTNVLRSGDIGFVVTRRYVDGALQPLFLLADEAPA